ncbi:MAG: aminoacyl-tRNA hydrolase [Candidatus Harrisonbacteria bacterium]|nr:aminoacyl-tRNA hydrolase [Candidatus Harrisonbacteria bacterium]
MAIKLVVGIGNPGQEYENTRHNVGFLFLDFLAKKAEGEFVLDKKIGALTAKGSISLKHKKVNLILAKLESYMNTSGIAVAKLKTALKVKPEDIVIVQDDIDIPFGNSKLSFDRNSGGHRGIESVIKSMKTKKFYRLRIGTGTGTIRKAHQEPEKKRDEIIKDYVLSRFTSKERETLNETFMEGLDKIIGLLNQRQ